MPVFDPSSDLDQQLDFQLLRDGPVSLFWSGAVLAKSCSWLADHGYSVVSLIARDWVSESDAHASIAAALDFPGYYGNNLGALSDCLADVAEGRYGLRSDDAGLVIVLIGYDTFTTRFPEFAHTILDIVARQSRTGLLVGHRMLCLVQSDEPLLTLGPVGASAADWNPSEWFAADRGV